MKVRSEIHISGGFPEVTLLETLLDIRYLLAVQVASPSLSRDELIPILEECKKLVKDETVRGKE